MLSKSHGQVDWSLTAREVRDLVRGADPWPGAATTFRGEALKLYGATTPEVDGEQAEQGGPGHILALDLQGIVVACGAGAVRIAELQAPGGRRMPAAALARGRG